MNTKLISLLTSICIACILIVFGEWLFALWAQSSTLDSIRSIEKKSLQDKMPHIDLHTKTEESYADFVSRPLFINGRRPVVEPSPEEINNAVIAPVVFEWQLNGVFSTKKGLSAFLFRPTAKTSKEKYRKISKEEDLDGWKLTEIYPDKVIFQQGFQQKELLLRKIKTKDPFKKANGHNIPNTPSAEEGQVPAELPPENTNE